MSPGTSDYCFVSNYTCWNGNIYYVTDHGFELLDSFRTEKRSCKGLTAVAVEKAYCLLLFND